MSAEKLLGVVKELHPHRGDSRVNLFGFSGLKGKGGLGGGLGGGWVCVGLDRSLEPVLGGGEENGTVLSQPPP